MNAAQLRNKIEQEGGVLGALDYGIRDEDIDDEALADAWYDLQVMFDNLVAEAAVFEEELLTLIDEQDLTT